MDVGTGGSPLQGEVLIYRDKVGEARESLLMRSARNRESSIWPSFYDGEPDYG